MPFPRPVEAVIFDMDGLLLDTEVVYERATIEAARSLGFEMSLTFCRSLIGVPGSECNILIQEHFGQRFSIEDFEREFRLYVTTALSNGIPVKPGVVELLAHLAARGLPSAVATSSRRGTALRHLGQCGLLEHFRAVVTRDDVSRGKPHPDLFLAAARALDVLPQHCLVLEDAHHGIAGAHAAGAMPILVPDILEATEEIRRLCIAVARDLHEICTLLA